MSFSLVYVFVGAALAYTLVLGVSLYRGYQQAVRLVAETRQFDTRTEVHSRTLLLLGDSTAHGVGALLREETTGGRLAQALDASVENRAESGAKTKDVLGQLNSAEQPRYDLIIIQVGANDVIYLSDRDTTTTTLTEVLSHARVKSDRIVLLTAGNIGDAPLWLWPLNRYYTLRTQALRESFMSVAQKEGVVYVDLFPHLSIFKENPQKYYAPDGLHLSGEGYALWAQYILETMRTVWPEMSQ